MSSEKPQEVEFIDALNDAFLHQHVEGATHNKGRTLDLVLSSEKYIIDRVEILNNEDLSDHHPLLLSVCATEKEEEEPNLVFDFKKANFQTMKQMLQNINWVAMFSKPNFEEVWK